MPSLNYGGQAVIEGVMMRGERDWAVAVRAPNGEIVVHRQPLNQVVYRSRVFKWPFIRGLTMLWDSLGLGLRALMWSADVAMGEESEASFTGPLAWGTVALSLGFGVALFFLLPMFLASLVDRYVASALLSNLLEGSIRLGLFLAYVWAIGFMPDIRRVFAYHGAEHKTISAYEHGAPLEPQAVLGYSRAHTRCGTGFLLGVVVIFVLVSTLMGRPPLWLRLASRIVLIPVVAGIAYEFLKLTSKYYDKSAFVRMLVAPNLALQRLTTRDPEPEMLEVSIRALQEVLISEGRLAQPADDQSTATDPLAGGKPAPA
ncbi:MAG: DUF1385 domain-containing protein [Chloroflexi bacterium]|jgi:uncharacterized protein YqhQ|nr:DUF1385 domain-containing protein [Chloroflexota bacterium]